MRASGTAVCIAIAMLAGCSKAPDNNDAPAASDTAGAPGIAVTAATATFTVVGTNDAPVVSSPTASSAPDS